MAENCATLLYLYQSKYTVLVTFTLVTIFYIVIDVYPSYYEVLPKSHHLIIYITNNYFCDML